MIHQDTQSRVAYATDGSIFKALPKGVAYPKSEKDLQELIHIARKKKTSLIPRTAGTSLGGQVVGSGIVVDFSHWNEILEIDREEKWVRVQPGVVLDELNLTLKEYGLMFGPETSTSKYCMIGGMIGNNACGNHSLLYGSTRDHLLEAKIIFSDGSKGLFSTNKKQENAFQQKVADFLLKKSKDHTLRKEIEKQYPDPRLHRRNSGYAIDLLFQGIDRGEMNLCTLLAGSEGTLCLVTEAKLALVELPPTEVELLIVECASMDESLKANIEILKHSPGAVEMMDKPILDCTKDLSEEVKKNRFFLQGDPAVVLIAEFRASSQSDCRKKLEICLEDLKSKHLGETYTFVPKDKVHRVWELRKIGLGVLANLPGEEKAIACIEDTAVHPEQLPAFIEEVNSLLKKNGKTSIHYAHVGAGELHLRPLLNLKKKSDQVLMQTLMREVTDLVKKYRGSLSGEHGDGMIRGPFLKQFYGEKIYDFLLEVKKLFDPLNIFNPGKITSVSTIPSTQRDLPTLEEVKEQVKKRYPRPYLYDAQDEMSVMAERCNGSGVCRKSHVIGGVMCPSYMATGDERLTTRARANLAREYFQTGKYSKEFSSTLSQCLSCKGCQSECPSNVDMGRLKAEFIQHKPWKDLKFYWLSRVLAYTPTWMTHFLSQGFLQRPVKFLLAIPLWRSLPRIERVKLKIQKNWNNHHSHHNYQEITLILDEVSGNHEAKIAKAAINLLNALGYNIGIEKTNTGRVEISQGILKKAKKIAHKNISRFKGKKIIGIEPSTILTFRDEYEKLLDKGARKEAIALKKNVFLIEEFLFQEMQAGHLKQSQFDQIKREIHYHSHCYQKALSTPAIVVELLSLPQGNKVTHIETTCCGMAGSFGYQQADLSKKIASLQLIPHIKGLTAQAIVSASGHSCRHQIKDCAGKDALHPVEILQEALIVKS